jgi:hypothetical protein
MAQDLYSLVTDMMEDGTFARLAANPLAQFGRPARQYLGASLLPERTVEENMFREDAVKYRTVIANDGTRYSPAQKKGNALVGSFSVELAHQDIATELTGREYDILVRLLGRGASMEAVAQLTEFVDRTALGLVEKSELQRWQAIVNASVPLTGDNGYSETVSYSDPAGHRAAAGGTWSSDAYDPFTDILAMADLLQGKGYTVSRIITSRTVLSILAGNDKVKARTGLPVVNVNGTIGVSQARANQAAINDALMRDGLPAIETYDLQYATQTGTGYFLDRASFVMLATTGRDETLDLGDTAPAVMQDTLGYLAIGRAVGQATPGRVIRSEAFSNKPPRVEVEAWQTSLPVILEPEAIAVINTIA